MKFDCFDIKITSNNKNKVSRQEFEDTTELAKYIKKAPTNKVWKGHSCSSRQEKEYGFNDFDTLEDAITALEYGTDIYYDNFKKNIQRVKDFLNKKEINKNSKYKNDRVGFLPIVPKVLQGNPINMINQDVKPKPFPTARIILEKSNSYGIQSDDMNEFYAIIFVLIQILENKGIRCEVWVVDSTYHDGEIVCLKVKLKNYMQPLNVYKIQFPIISSDFFRRIGFRILETNPDIETDWYFGYGKPLLKQYSIVDQKEQICNIIGIEEDDVYVKSCQEYDYHCGDDLDETIEKLITSTNFNKYIELK